MKWIKVEDGLPASSKMVLCYMPAAYSGYRGIHYGWITPRLDYKGKPTGELVWKEHSPFSYAHDMEDPSHTGCGSSRVTHWMALPDKPEEDPK